MDIRNIFASNLNEQMNLKGVGRKELSEALGISYYTVSDWVNGKKYPRMDKVEKLAEYFGILKSDLIEVKTKERVETQKKADTITDAVLRMKTDSEFLSLVEKLAKLDSSQIRSVDQMLVAFLK